MKKTSLLPEGPLVNSTDELLFAFNQSTLIDISDTDGIILDVNERFCELSGYSKCELIGQDHRLLNSGKHPASMFKTLWDTVLSGNMWRAEVCNKIKTGEYIWLDTTIVPIKNEQGKVYRFITVSYDITARVNTVAQKESYTGYLEALYANSHDIIWRWDLQNNTIEFNKNICSSLGLRSVNFNNAPKWFEQKIHPDDLTHFWSIVNGEETERMKSSQKDIRIRDNKGKYRYFMVSTITFKDKSGNGLERIGSMLDITDRKLKEEEMMEAIIHAQDQERRKIGMELHDNVMQMLAAGTVYLSYFEEKNGNQPQPELEMVKKLMYESMQDIRKLSHQLAPAVNQNQPLLTGIRKLVDSMKHHQYFKINLQYKCSEERSISPEITTHIYRILQEQLNNVHKHAQASRVEIKISGLEKELRIQIADNGRGFNPVASREGIGMENIRRRVELSNGKLQLITAPGKGCKLDIRIPVMATKRLKPAS